MTKSALLASTAVALFMCAAPATAQMQQKEDKAGPSQMQREQGQSKEQGATERKGDAAQDTDQRGKATKGTAEKDAEPKGKASKGTAEKSGEPKDKATKGTAEKSPEPKDKAAKGATNKAESKDKATKGAAERDVQTKDKAAGAEPKDKSGSAKRVQISEEKRTNIHQNILKDRSVNRVTKVNFSINIGTRVPRSVRLVVLPVSVIEIVPEYRSYRYFVVDDQICIVEPDTYEIVEVIRVSDRTADRDNRGGSAARLVLTDAEKAIILRGVDMRSESTLGLGTLTEGAEIPRGVSVREFPATVVDQVPKIKDYRFFTAENRIAIVDRAGAKVELVIEERR